MQHNNVTHVKTLYRLWLPWIILNLVGKLYFEVEVSNGNACSNKIHQHSCLQLFFLHGDDDAIKLLIIYNFMAFWIYVLKQVKYSQNRKINQ